MKQNQALHSISTEFRHLCSILLVLIALINTCSPNEQIINQRSKRSQSETGSNHISQSQSQPDLPDSNAPKPIQDCPLVPKIDITSYSRAGWEPASEFDTELIYINPRVKNVIYAPFPAHILLQCLSTSPIEWIFDGPFHPSITSIESFYDTESTNISGTNSSEFQNAKSCFRITVKLETTKTSTGKYWCRTVDQKYSSLWYLYGAGNSPPSLLYHGNEFNIIPNGTQPIVLPCQVVNPNVKPHLTKGDTAVIAIDNSVPYDSQIGFTLDLKKIPNPYGKYKCMIDDDPIVFNIQQTPDYLVTPTSATIILVQQQVVTLICEGKDPIALQGFLDDSKVTFPDYMEGTEYTYRVQYNFSGNENAQVSCVNLTSKNVHHLWNLRVIEIDLDRKIVDESGIFYNPTTNLFTCRSKTKDQPVMNVGHCSNPMECLLLDKCFTWDVPYKLTRTRIDNCPTAKISRGGGTPCSPRDYASGSAVVVEEYSPNEKVGCVTAKNSGQSGVVRCNVKELAWSSVMYYFNGLKSEKGLVISDWKQAPLEELLNIASEQEKLLYVGESIQFTCKATKFLFSFGFKWAFRMTDGSFTQPKREKTVNNHSTSSYSQTTNLKIESTRIEAVICYVHFWNSTEWLNVSRSLNVSESIAPIITPPNGGQPVVFTTGSNQSITCHADGTPAPDVNWYRKGERLEFQSPVTENNSTIPGSSRLYFGHVDVDDEGDYGCVASNVRGIVTKQITVSVTSYHSSIYTGIVIAVFVFICFIVIVAVLWWKLRVNKRIIKKLTQKEYEQFRKGDKKAMLNAADGYIRAQFMPYDEDYEIPEENLDIDKDSILGSGEYGLVLKGTLRQNNRESEVAVKTNKTSSDSNHLKALLCELKILTYIGWHDNVINLLGAVTRHLRERDVYVVVEYCRLGNLENYLRANKPFYLNQILNDKIDLSLTFNTSAASAHYQPMQFTTSTTDLITWAYQVASGMEYLANKKIIHGDLATRNLLLNEDRTVKITDFGLSKHLYNDCSNYVCHTPGPLPWKWLAPETLQYQKFSTPSDVWAFSITLWEIFSLGESPYPGIAYNFDFKYKLLEGFRMGKPEFANSCIWNVVQKCWATTPADRPAFPELRRYFHWLLHNWDDPRGPPKLRNNDEVRYINPNELDHILFKD